MHKFNKTVEKNHRHKKGDYIVKKIIDGKLYDTESADFVLEYEKDVLGLSHYGFITRTYETTIYRTKKGNWFEVRDDNFYILTIENVKRIIRKYDTDLYLELYEVEEA
ncbi:hypothetical protein [Salipaludibacillus sp. CF4.18]|uniref:hypothetical protein n=1 Tax=Salipaludibacillus sp. CF4.18 TaxID=3373081 RepID=UPI003EE71647